MGDEKTFEESLRDIAGMGLKAADLVGATADLVEKLMGDEAKDNGWLLTGDPVADAAIIRAAGVEDVIRTKWNLDTEKVLEFVNLIAKGATTLAPMFA